MGKGWEEENLFLHQVVKGATGSSMKTKTGASKVNVSMPKDLFDYVKRCVEEHNAKPENIYRPTDFSKMIQKAVHEMMECEESAQKKPDKTSKDAPIIQPEDHSGGGPSTRITDRSRRTG